MSPPVESNEGRYVDQTKIGIIRRLDAHTVGAVVADTVRCDPVSIFIEKVIFGFRLKELCDKRFTRVLFQGHSRIDKPGGSLPAKVFIVYQIKDLVPDE